MSDLSLMGHPDLVIGQVIYRHTTGGAFYYYGDSRAPVLLQLPGGSWCSGGFVNPDPGAVAIAGVEAWVRHARTLLLLNLTWRLQLTCRTLELVDFRVKLQNLLFYREFLKRLQA